MGFGVVINPNINPEKIAGKIDNDNFWTYAAVEWWRLITPFVPRVSGTLAENVTVSPKTITYHSPYAHYLYKGELMVSPTTGSSWAKHGEKKVYAGTKLSFNNPKACREWDKAAIPTQRDKLIRAMQKYIKKTL